MVACFSPDTDFEALKGREVGTGQTRAAFEVHGQPGQIVKECLGSHEANWTEYIVFNSLVGEKVEDLFGRCIAISQTGKFLIMERLDDLTPEQLPLRPAVPAWFTDRKSSAWGFSSNSSTVKIRDYGTLALGRTLAYATQEPLPTATDTAAMRGLIAKLR